jgi:hypothetical protein
MPRPQSENTVQISFKLPEEALARAEAIALKMSRPAGIGAVTRTEVLRAAVLEGLDRLQKRGL